MFIPRMLSKIVDNVARQTIGKDWNLYAALLEHWPEIVGHEYASVTTPVKMTFPHQPQEPRQRNGTLCVRLPKGLAMEFTFKTDQIRQRINAYFGYDAVGKIVFDPVFGVPMEAPAPAPQLDAAQLADIERTTAGVEDEDLRAALTNFAAAIQASNNREK